MSKKLQNLIGEFFDKKAKSWDKSITKNDVENLKKIISIIKLKKYNSVLDIGCGTGIAYNYLSKKFKRYIGIDLSKEMIKIARRKFKCKKTKFIAGSFEEYNFKNKFDLIFIFNTFPHILNKKLFLQKVKKLLNKSGKIVIAHSLPLRKINQIHERIENPIISRQKINSKLIKELLKNAKFKNIKIISKNFFYAESNLD